MRLDELASRLNGVRWSGDEKFRARCPCVTHRDGDPDCSLVARVVQGQIVVACFADLGDSTETILSAVGLTSTDLRAQNSPAKGPKSLAAPFSQNGARSAPSSPRRMGYALAYAGYGYPVFPLHEKESDGQCSCGRLTCESLGKHPRYKGWQQEATTDSDKIRQWWSQTPTANIGVACGEKANLTVLDVDGDEGRNTLRALELENGELPETPIVITQSGGNHYYFQYEPNTHNDVKFAPGLDVRTDGGLVVGVGSKIAGQYLWEASAQLSATFQPAKMPQWLAALMKQGKPKAEGTTLDTGAVLAGVDEGNRDNMLFKLACKLRNTDVPIDMAIELIGKAAAKCKPPFPTDIAIEKVHRAYQTYLPAVAQTQVPAVSAEINREPMDAYQAYEVIRAEPRVYTWDGVLRQCCTVVLTALMGAGKTTLAMNLVWGWSYERDVLDRPCLASKTLVVVSPKEYEAWVDTIGFWDIRGKVFIIPSLNTQYPTGVEQARWFQEKMKKYQCQTFVLDTMFDFYGIPPHNTGDANRMAMAEQTPLLECVRLNHWSGLVTGHSPKSEAQAIVSRDPEEAFAGHTAWTAQHRMRAVIRRKAKGASTFLTGRGGLGDRGFLDERMLLFDEQTRLVSLGGKFSDYLGETALPSVLEALTQGWAGRSALTKLTGKGEGWVKAAIKKGLKDGKVKSNNKGSRSRKYALPDEPDEEEQQKLL